MKPTSFSNKKAVELSFSKVILLLLLGVVIILSFNFLLKSSSEITGNISSLSLLSMKQDCDIGLSTCSFKNCDREICESVDKEEWDAWIKYQDTCKDKIGDDRDKFDCHDSILSKLENNMNEPTQYVVSDEQYISFKNKVSSNTDSASLVNLPINKYRELSKEDLDNFFDLKKHPELKKLSSTFIESAKENNIDPYYLVSHFALETGWGTSRIWKEKYNGFGISAYDDSPYTSALEFKSEEEGIAAGAKWIAGNYLHAANDDYRKSKTLAEMNRYYATDKEWQYKIAYNMDSLNSVG